MKIALCSAEVFPFAKTGGLADVAGALPLALEQAGQEVIIITPRYKDITDARFKLRRLSGDIATCAIGENVQVYFVENQEYFNRAHLYGDSSGDYKDNLERFSYYCRRVLKLLKEIDFKPDIIHLHDWQTSLIPVYLKTEYARDAFFAQARTVLTIHNIGYQGLFPKDDFPKTGLAWDAFSVDGLEFFGRVNVLKGGIEFADMINTVSPTYSKEIQTQEYGFGLEGVLGKRRGLISGILNGLDYQIWNPETDTHIAARFSPDAISGKYINKEQLQKVCGLPQIADVPLCGIVSRLAEQKGFDILEQGIDEICRLNLQLAILGTGDIKYHRILADMAKKYPNVVWLHVGFDETLAHQVYAGSDIFLMPSKYEPCGLGQMIALRYATLPLVFATGGLVDTVDENNGFIFHRYQKDALVKTIQRACAAYQDKKAWSELIQRAMRCSFSWEKSAKEYVELYAKAKKARQK